jgi:hypothetical protein
MKKSNLIKIFILLFVQLSFGQIKSILVDENTKRPIEYANIWIENEVIGTFSNDKGYFSLITKSENNIIVISHVGYQSKSVLISEIKDTIFLNPIIIKLDEISVFQRKNRNQIILDEIKNKQVDLYFGTNLNYPWIVAKYFPFNEKFPELKFLKKISLMTGINKKANFNIRIYSVDKEGKPFEYLTSENINVTAEKGINKTEIDVSKLNILFPENGLFIAIENIRNINSDEFKNTSLVLGLDLNNKSQKTYLYYKGKWVENIDFESNIKNKLLNLFKATMIELTLTD